VAFQDETDRRLTRWGRDTGYGQPRNNHGVDREIHTSWGRA